MLKGEVEDVVLLDVTPLSLGIETMGGVMTKVIERNTTIPSRRTETFSTAEDNQTAVDVVVLQGERELAADNRQLARFRLEGIAPAPRGVPQIEVTFDIDANGILNVSARDKATGAEQRVTIEESTNLDQTEIERMVREAQEHSAEDRRRREEIDARNELDSLAYQADTLVKELQDQLPVNEKARAEELIAEARQMIEEQAGLDRVRPLDRRPAADRACAACLGLVDHRRLDTERRRQRRACCERARRRRGGRCRVHPRVSRIGPPGPGIEDLQARVDELDDRYRRALADLDNYRKRSERLADSRVADARDRMLRDWLDAVDSVETALDMTSSDGEVEGLKAVRDQMRSILERQGVQRFGATGEGFDPDRHEAIAARESDAVPDRSIVDVVRAGYMVGDRVLRPARVIVSRRPDGES